MKTLKKFSALLLCLALISGAFAVSASAAGNGISGKIKSLAFPEEFKTFKLLMFNSENSDLDSGVYPTDIEFTFNDGTVVNVKNELNDYGFDSGFSGSLDAYGASHKVAAYYTDLKEGEKITFHITVDGADVYCEEAKFVYSQALTDLLSLQLKILNDFSHRESDSVSLINIISDNIRSFTEYRKAVSSQGPVNLAELVIFNLKYDIRNIKNILTCQFLAELFK